MAKTILSQLHSPALASATALTGGSMCSLPSLHAVVSIYVDEYSVAVISIHVDECSQKKLSYAECNALENITAEPTMLP